MVSPDRVNRLIREAQYVDSQVGSNTTVVTMALQSGFTITEQAACIDPANYNHELGISICKSKLLSRLYDMEAYHQLATAEENRSA